MNLFLVFGEDHNDRAALIHLIRALIPPGASGKAEQRRKPLILRRNAGACGKRREMSEDIAAFARVMEREDIKVVAVVHSDCDAVEPAHVEEAKALNTDLKRADVRHPMAVTPAWEIETWWMLFPNAVKSVRSCWKKIDYGERHVGAIQNSKEQLTRDLRPASQTARQRCPDYRESDGIKIAQRIADNPRHLTGVRAKSYLFVAFATDIQNSFSTV